MPSLNPTKIEDTHWKHGNVFLDDAQLVRIHYIDCPPLSETSSSKKSTTILLIHGFPNTSYQWRHVITTPVHVLGHDIGGMIAHAYAFAFPNDIKSVTWGECPLPGSTPYESGFKNSPGMWHFTFQQQTDLPEALVAGRERNYLKHFYDRLCVNPAAISPHDHDHYVTSFAQPGGMRCGFELYRAFPRDARDNQRLLREGEK